MAVLEREWTRFQEHFDVVHLADNGNLDQVLNWYFDKRPPFGDGKKSKEFPDALVISALDKYCAEHKTRVAVISRDGDFAKASTSRPHFEFCESLSVYLERSIAEQATIQRIHELLESRDKAFRDGIKEHFQELEFSVEQDWEGDVEDVRVTDVDIREQSVIDFEGIKFTVSVEGFISYKAHVSYADYLSATYDSSEGDVFIHHYVNTTIRDRIRFSAAIDIQADDEFKEFEDYSIGYFSPESVSIDADEHQDLD